MRSDRLRLRRLSLLLSLTLMPWTGVVAQTASTSSTQSVALPRLTRPVNEKDLVTIKGTVHPLASAKNDRGVVDGSTSIGRVHLVLKRSALQEQQLETLIQNMHTPGAAGYHTWLTPDQFGAQFGPSDQDIATISSWLGSHGLAVTKVNPGKQTLEITGTVGSLNTAFHTSIHKFEANGQIHTANASDPQIPSALAPVLGGFVSLNNFPLRSMAHVLGRAEMNTTTHEATPEWTLPPNAEANAPTLLLAPGDFAVQYDVNPVYSAGITGAGQTIAIINESNVSPVLVAQYRSLFGLPASPVNVIIDGNDPGINGINNPDGQNGAAGEAYLDVEQAGSVAPGATIDLVIAADTALEQGVNLAAEHAVYSDIAPVLSISFGSCEAGGNSSFWSALWEQAAAQGQTVSASTGDSGSASCDDDNSQDYAVSGQQVSGIASTPYNVAVGGTDMYFTDYATGSTDGYAGAATYWNLNPTDTTPTVSLKSKAPEQPFNGSQYGLDYFPNFISPDGGGTSIVAAGGGASNCATYTTNSDGTIAACIAGVPKPAWQVGAGVPADGVRDLPDVSLFGSLYFNLVSTPICAEDGDCQPASAGGTVQVTAIGGTSVSAPSFAGVMALVNQKYGPQGQADFVLYKLAAQFPSTSTTPVFNDVQVGSNSVPCNITSVSYEGSPIPPYDCIAVANPLTATDPTYGPATEGQIGNTTTNTPEYNAAAGYDLASGLGSVDVNNLITNWSKVTFSGSTVTLTPSQTTFAHGTAITVSGTVTPATAGGTVALETTSAEPLQAVTTAFTVANGAYTGSVDSLPGGTYTIFGKYGGDGTNGASSSTPVSITVTPESSFMQFVPVTGSYVTGGAYYAISGSGATVPYGTQIELAGDPVPTTYYNTCLTPANPPASCGTATYTQPTGTVTFTDGGETLDVGTLNSEGDAEFNTALGVGKHTLGASYSGDSSYNSSSGASFSLIVQQDQPEIAFSSGTQTTATVSGAAGTTDLTVQIENSANFSLILGSTGTAGYGPYIYSPVAAPTGVVTVTGLGSGPLTFPALQAAIDPALVNVEAVASLEIPASVPAGTYTNVTVSYPGDANYMAVSATVTVVITGQTGIATSTSATSSLSSTTPSSRVSVTYTVTGTTVGGSPTGSLVISSGGYQVYPYVAGGQVATISLPASGSGTSYTGTFQVDSSTLYGGQNVLTVQYLGSSVYAPSSATLTIANGNPGTPGISLTSSGAITIASPGGSGSSTITVTPVGGFTGPVTMNCAVTPNTETDTPTCSVGSVTVSGTTAATATLTVNTTSGAASLKTPQLRSLLGGGIAMATLLFLVTPKRRRLTTLLGAVVLMAAIGFSAGCGSGSGGGSTGGGGGTTGGTTTGAYTVTVTATGTGVTAATTTVQVTVN